MDPYPQDLQASYQVSAQQVYRDDQHRLLSDNDDDTTSPITGHTTTTTTIEHLPNQHQPLYQQQQQQGEEFFGKNEKKYNSVLQPLEDLSSTSRLLEEASQASSSWTKQYSATFHDWDVLNTSDETACSSWTWLLNQPVIQALMKVIHVFCYLLLCIVTPQFILRILSPPVHTYRLSVSNKKILVQHYQKLNKLEEKSSQTEVLVKDLIGSSVTIQNVSRPFFFATEAYPIRNVWNRVGIFVMYAWLLVTALLQYLMSFPAKAGYAFASLLLINFLVLYGVHLMWIVILYIRQKKFVKNRMQPLWQTIAFFVLMAVVFFFNMMGFKNRTAKDYVYRPFYSAYPALVIFWFAFMNFYPRVSFGTYAELTMSYKQWMSGHLQQKVLLSLADAENAKLALEKATKYHE